MYPITTQIIVMLFVVHFALSRQVEFKKAESDPGFTAKERSNSKEGHYVPKLGVRLQKTPASFLSVVPFDSVTLECEAEGNPSPTIYWLKNGRRIHQGTWEESGLSQEININEMVTRGVSRTRSRLYLDCVSAKDEGIFSCIAENPYQRVSGKTNLKLSEERETRNAICVAKNHLVLRREYTCGLGQELKPRVMTSSCFAAPQETLNPKSTGYGETMRTR
ncbi:leucine-rich repeat and fibronectin type III domain-containing protein 1-like protein isoform X2 [Tachypleus tridentatus]|uniref:leucine-rich repeat and fibronectin type III domain-containing protein 1-like protein isoform X2 n=1 Tax=Tachypleus tridentatus TaxID=6853 RepID=UPI003FD1BE26